MLALTPTRLAHLRLCTLPFVKQDGKRTTGALAASEIDALLLHLVRRITDEDNATEYESLQDFLDALGAPLQQWTRHAGLDRLLDLHALYKVQTTIDQLMASPSGPPTDSTVSQPRLEAHGVISLFLRQAYLALETLTFNQALQLVKRYNQWTGANEQRDGTDTPLGFLKVLHEHLQPSTLPFKTKSPAMPRSDLRRDYDLKGEDAHPILLSLALEHAQRREYASARHTLDEVLKLSRERGDRISLTQCLILERQIERWDLEKPYSSSQTLRDPSTVSMTHSESKSPTLQATLLLLDVDQILQHASLDLSSCLPRLLRAKAILDNEKESSDDQDWLTRVHLKFQLKVLESAWWSLLGHDRVAGAILNQILDYQLSGSDRILRACHHATRNADLGHYDVAVQILLTRPHLPVKGVDVVAWKAWNSTMILVMTKKQLALGHPRLALELLACYAAESADSMHAQIICCRAEALQGIGRPKDARETLNALSRQMPESIDVVLTLVRIQLRQRLWSQSVRQVVQCLETTRESHRRAHHLCALVYCAEGCLGLRLYEQAFDLLDSRLNQLLAFESLAFRGYTCLIFGRCLLAMTLDNSKQTGQKVDTSELRKVEKLWGDAIQDLAGASEKALEHEAQQRLSDLLIREYDRACFGAMIPKECDEGGVQRYSMAREQIDKVIHLVVAVSAECAV